MVLLGAVLVAMGVAALIGVSLWPAILIAIGGLSILSTVPGLARKHLPVGPNKAVRVDLLA